MGKRLWRKGFITMLVVVALVIAGLAVIPAMADEGNDTQTSPKNEYCESHLSKLAARLGITVDELQTAFTDVNLQMIDEAVANGLIDQERADQIKERIADGNGTCGFGPGFLGKGPHGPRGMGLHPGPGLMGLMGKAIENGIITQEQADQIESLGKQIREQAREQLKERFGENDGLEGFSGVPSGRPLHGFTPTASAPSTSSGQAQPWSLRSEPFPAASAA